MVDAVEQGTEADPQRRRALVEPAVEHLVRLEAYFRLNGLTSLAQTMDAALEEAESVLNAAPRPLALARRDSRNAQPQHFGRLEDHEPHEEQEQRQARS